MTKRRALVRRVDANQSAIVARLRELGYSVVDLHTVGAGCPDIAVAGYHRSLLLHLTMLVEIKAAAGTLTSDEEQFITGWNAPVVIARCAGDVLRAFGWTDEEARDACERNCQTCSGPSALTPRERSASG